MISAGSIGSHTKLCRHEARRSSTRGTQADEAKHVFIEIRRDWERREGREEKQKDEGQWRS